MKERRWGWVRRGDGQVEIGGLIAMKGRLVVEERGEWLKWE
jgi:hypothetical protein